MNKITEGHAKDNFRLGPHNYVGYKDGNPTTSPEPPGLTGGGEGV